MITENDNSKITKEEYESIAKALEKKEFRDLFFDYMKEISDPVNRKKYEEEISALEAERGMSVRWVRPEDGFVIKTKDHENLKIFINICCSPEIEKANSRDAIKKGGQNWSIPYSLSKPREDLDKSKFLF